MSFTVSILRSEKREVDELDTKPFTMYVLEVRSAAQRLLLNMEPIAHLSRTGECAASSAALGFFPLF